MLIFGKYTEDELDEWHKDIFGEEELWEFLKVTREEYNEFLTRGLRK